MLVRSMLKTYTGNSHIKGAFFNSNFIRRKNEFTGIAFDRPLYF